MPTGSDYGAQGNTGRECFSTGRTGVPTGQESFSTGRQRFSTGQESLSTGYQRFSTGRQSFSTGRKGRSTGDFGLREKIRSAGEKKRRRGEKKSSGGEKMPGGREKMQPRGLHAVSPLGSTLFRPRHPAIIPSPTRRCRRAPHTGRATPSGTCLVHGLNRRDCCRRTDSVEPHLQRIVLRMDMARTCCQAAVSLPRSDSMDLIEIARCTSPSKTRNGVTAHIDGNRRFQHQTSHRETAPTGVNQVSYDSGGNSATDRASQEIDERVSCGSPCTHSVGRIILKRVSWTRRWHHRRVIVLHRPCADSVGQVRGCRRVL